MNVLTYIILFLLPTLSLFAQNSDSVARVQTDSTVLYKFNIESSKPTSSEEIYLPEQDDYYQTELATRLPSAVRFRNAILETQQSWQLSKELHRGLPLNVALENVFNLPASAFLPTGQEIVQHEINKIKAFEVPFVPTYNPYGLKIPLNLIGTFLGITEDVSPDVSYSLDNSAEVEVVVYSIGANVVATLFAGPQSAGRYKLTWNLRDTNGKRMPSGDYIAEVRIGKTKLIRKRIVIY